MNEVKITKEHVLSVYNRYSELPKLLKARYIIGDVDQKKYEMIEIKKNLPEECLMGLEKNCINTWSGFARKIACDEVLFSIKTIIENKHIKTTHSNSNISNIYYNIQELTQDLLNKGFVPDLILIPLKIFVDLRSYTDCPNGYLKICNIMIKVIHSSKCQNFDEIIVIDTDSISSSYKLDKRTNERLWMDITKVYDEQINVNIRSEMNLEIINSDGIEIMKIKR